jgi:DNA anti-recombination protein RmuC
MQLMFASVVGALIGFALAWLVSRSRWQARLSDYKVQAEANLKGAESTIQGLRSNLAEAKVALDAKLTEISHLQESLKGEGEQKAAAQAELKEARSAVEDLGAVRDRLGTESQLRVTAETKLSESEKNLEEQKKLLDDAKARLPDTFNALSADALRSNNQAFLALARSAFETIQAQATGDLNARQQAIDAVVAPLKQSLDRYEIQVKEMERARQTAYGSLEEQLRALASTNQQLQKETGSLVTALRNPQVRGRWGEMTLRRAAELGSPANSRSYPVVGDFHHSPGFLAR